MIPQTYLHFKASSSDMGEYMDLGLPPPASIQKWNIGYSICWLIDGYFGTKAGQEYLNDIIARLFLTMPSISERLLFEPREYTDPKQKCTLRDFWPLVEKAKKHKVGVSHNSVGKDAIFVALKVWIELRIREQGEGRTVAYSILESFAFNMFEDKAKDKSTLRAKCRSIWEWYDARGWKNTRYLHYTKKDKEQVMATRRERALLNAEKRAKEAKAKVLNCVTGLMSSEYKKKNGDWNVAKIAKDMRLSRTTVYKYLKEVKD